MSDLSAPDLPGIVITGASGRMGQMLINTVVGSDRCKLVGVVEREGHDWVGRDVGEAMGGAALGVNVTQSRGVVAIDGEMVCHV